MHVLKCTKNPMENSGFWTPKNWDVFLGQLERWIHRGSLRFDQIHRHPLSAQLDATMRGTIRVGKKHSTWDVPQMKGRNGSVRWRPSEPRPSGGATGAGKPVPPMWKGISWRCRDSDWIMWRGCHRSCCGSPRSHAMAVEYLGEVLGLGLLAIW